MDNVGVFEPIGLVAALPEEGGVSNPKPINTVSPPPTRFSPAAKEAWDEVPEPVRAEVSRLEKEFAAGFAKYRAAATRDASLAEFHDMAAKSGTTVKEALSKYVGMENQLRADTVKGLEIICQNIGMSLREVAAKVLGLAPDHGQGAEESVTKFASENPRFGELSEDIALFLTSGRTKDLAEAYEMAERLNPVPARWPQRRFRPNHSSIGTSFGILNEFIVEQPDRVGARPHGGD